MGMFMDSLGLLKVYKHVKVALLKKPRFNLTAKTNLFANASQQSFAYAC